MSFDTTSKALAKAFGNALRAAREATGRTPEQAADLLFCEHGFYRRLEAGQSLPSFLLAAQAVDLLGVDPSAALGSQLTDEHRAAIAALRQECEDLQTELGRVRADRDKAFADRDEARRCAERLATACGSMAQDLGDISGERDFLGARLDDRNAEYSALLTTCERLQQERDKALAVALALPSPADEVAL